ncbi:TetR/AcrR family transcriptional regulator [Microbacteriaceae bacterium 4G12]
MQYLKEDVKKRILTAGLEEFKEKGYVGASIRNIASSAGVALGSVYKYFENKEDLFNSLVGIVYHEVLANLKKSSDSNGNPIDKATDMKDRLLDIFRINNTELLILFDKSKGSKYESFKEEIIAIIHTIFQEELLLQLTEKGIVVKDPFIFYVLSSTFLEGVNTILRSIEDGERVGSLIDQLIYILFEDIEQHLVEMSRIF